MRVRRRANGYVEEYGTRVPWRLLLALTLAALLIVTIFGLLSWAMFALSAVGATLAVAVLGFKDLLKRNRSLYFSDSGLSCGSQKLTPRELDQAWVALLASADDRTDYALLLADAEGGDHPVNPREIYEAPLFGEIQCVPEGASVLPVRTTSGEFYRVAVQDPDALLAAMEQVMIDRRSWSRH